MSDAKEYTERERQVGQAYAIEYLMEMARKRKTEGSETRHTLMVLGMLLAIFSFAFHFYGGWIALGAAALSLALCSFAAELCARKGKDKPDGTID